MALDYPDLLDAVTRSQERVAATLATLGDDEARAPSRLPGWTRGHVVTHLCRNADAVWRFATGVLTGVPGVMYPGGPDARNSAIEEGADRPTSLLAADFDFTGSRLARALAQIPADRLDTEIAWRRPVTAYDLPLLRWRELEIHHIDLGLAYSLADWPDEFVSYTLASERPRLAAAAPDVTAPELPDAQLLAWLVGRPQSSGLPELPPWPF
ncbi:MAG TPA: maleylpyruvate isomerase family mycothiol-dependent enzyme [Aldersonia sp.]